MKRKLKKALSVVLTIGLLVSMVPATVMADTAVADGTTTGEPFAYGTGGSNSFRIPALVTTSDGTLVAAADARWNTTYDGGGLDTIVSRSDDDGATWSYTFANYLGDNGNVYAGDSSTAFIDPALAVTKDDTIYMLVDLYPYGVALNGSGHTRPVTTKGFNDDGYLLLSNNDHSSYGYYLKDGKIYSSNGTEQTGYTVDAYFNITGTDGTDTNLFFSDSPFKVVRTGFLYLTKSTDDGATWSEPELLDLKTTSEMVCLVAPGRGLVTESGTIIFPVYSFHGDNDPSGNTQRMSFIYSTDGVTWNRTSEYNYNWASESAVVELNDGTLRFFFRNGTTNLCYVDYAMSSATWGTLVNTGLDTNSNCQMSAITYSKTIGGKQVVLVSCPTGPSEAGSNLSSAANRLNGKMFAFTVADDNTMTHVGTKSITSNDAPFMYSCMTELRDGTIGILYEDKENAWGAGYDSNGKECYYSMSYDEYDLTTAMGLTFDAEVEVPETVTATDKTTDVSVSAADVESVTAKKLESSTPLSDYTVSVTYDVLINGGAYTDAAEIKIPYDNIFDGCIEFVGHVPGTDGDDTFAVEVKDGYFVGKVPHFTDVTISGRSATPLTVRLAVGETSETYTVDGVYVTELDDLNSSIATASLGGQEGVPATVKYTEASDTCWNLLYYDTTYHKTDYYVLAEDEKYYPLYVSRTSTNSSNTWYYSYTYYYSTDNGATYVNCGEQLNLTYKNINTNINITVYTKTGTEAVPAYTTVAFKGVKVGNTSTAIGTTQFNITVYETIPVTVNYVANGTTIYSDNSSYTIDSDVVTKEVTLPASIAVGSKNYEVLDTTITINNGTVTYNVDVKEIEGTPISIKENETKALSVTLSDGQYVEWSTSDSSYVGVAGVYVPGATVNTGSYGNEGVIIGHNVTTNPTVVTGTVYNENGTVAGTYKWLVTVTQGDADTNTSSRYIYVNVTDIINCTAYYSINAGELIEINGTGVLIDADEKTSGHFNIMFFAAPDDGYALTYMGVTGSDLQYYTLSNGNPDGTGSDAWPFDSVTQSTIPNTSGDSAWVDGHGFRWPLLEGNYDIDAMKVMFANAISLGCDGVTNFTKNATTNYYCEVAFVAQKLPEMEKSIVSITRTKDDGTKETIDYISGMTLGIGDIINYKINITIPAELQGGIYSKDADGNHSYTVTSPITASNKPTYTTGSYGSVQLSEGVLTDTLKNTNLQLYTNQTYTTEFNGTLKDTTTSTSEQTLTYYTYIQLAAGNFLSVVDDGKITNSAELEFKYSSNYTTGTLDEKSDAVAEILVEVPEYVLDFGLPVEIDLTNDPLVDGDKIKEASAKNGTVVIDPVNPRKFTYTPNKAMPGTDFVTLTFYDMKLENGTSVSQEDAALIGYGVRIYPATTVYYEEDFATLNGFEVSGTASGTKQTASEVGDAKDNATYHYGYDNAYASTTGASNGTEAVSSTTGSTAVFTFVGTGVDIYTNSTTKTGTVMIALYKGSGDNLTLKKIMAVDTVARSGSTESTDGQNISAYNLPMATISGLEQGEYTIKISHVKAGSDQGNRTDGVKLDGFRVYGTLAPNTTAYVSDLEDNPEFYQLRDMVLYGLSVNDNTSAEYGSLAQMSEQVYAGISTDGEQPAVILNENNSYTTANVQDLLDNGPKNELFLHAGETLVFKVSTARVMQLGMKAPSGATYYEISGITATDQTGTLTSSTDMFYTLGNTVGTTKEYTVTVKNTGSNILSITDLKICDDPNATFEPLTVDDIETALVAMGFEPDSVYADATLNIAVNDANGNALATTQLTANGIEGEEATFAAADIQAAVATLELPDNYNLDDVTYSDVTVTYGSEDSVAFTAEKELTQEEKVVETVKQIFSSITNFFKKFFRW